SRASVGGRGRVPQRASGRAAQGGTGHRRRAGVRIRGGLRFRHRGPRRQRPVPPPANGARPRSKRVPAARRTVPALHSSGQLGGRSVARVPLAHGAVHGARHAVGSASRRRRHRGIRRGSAGLAPAAARTGASRRLRPGSAGDLALLRLPRPPRAAHPPDRAARPRRARRRRGGAASWLRLRRRLPPRPPPSLLAALALLRPPRDCRRPPRWRARVVACASLVHRGARPGVPRAARSGAGPARRLPPQGDDARPARPRVASQLAPRRCAAVLAARNLSIAWEVGNGNLGPPSTYERLAEEVRARVPPGSLLFTDDTFRTAPIYASLPEYRYISMADPSLLHAANPGLFWQWHHAVHDGTYCRARTCDGAPSGSEAVAGAVRAFSSEWIVTDASPHPSAMVRAMAGAPDRFELVGGAQAGGFGLVLWHLKPASPGSALAAPRAGSGG